MHQQSMSFAISAIANILRLMRVSHELKQKDLAQKLNVSTSHLSEIESGKKTPTLSVLNRYANIFQVPTWGIILLAENASSNFEHLNLEELELISSKLAKLAAVWMYIEPTAN